MPHPATSRFSDLLRRYRVAAGLSQAQLAERAGLSLDGVGALESGRRTNPRPYTVRMLADALSLAGDERRALIAAAQSGLALPEQPLPGAARMGEDDRGQLIAPPRPPTRLIGREREVAEIAFALRSGRARLLTLTGPGGVGKTRLAIAATDAMAGDFADGVVWVELAHIMGRAEHAAALVAGAIARAIGAKEPTPQSLAVSLAAAIGSRTMLLVLDNFEHLLGAAPLIADVLAACAELVVLVTSRERLHLRGEHEFAVHPLAVPDLDRVAGEGAAGWSSVAAVRLFAERAVDVRGDFALTEANIPAVAQLCRHLDGLPLAIELAVPWVKILSPEALAERLTPRLPLLAGGPDDLPDRQQTMRDTIAWSYALLRPAEQRLFRRLGVFAGGFTLEAAEVVGGERGEEGGKGGRSVLALLAALVDKSLVRPMATTAPENAARFEMLETIREFALEQLVASGEAEEARAAHAAHFVALVKTLIPAPGGGAQEAGWLERLVAEVANLRLVIALVVERGDAEAAFRLAEAWQLLAWSSRADSAEALRWLEAAMALGSSSPVERVHALIAAAGLVGLRGDFARAAALAEQGREVAVANDYPFGVAYALFYGGVVAKWRGELAEAAARLEGAIAGWRSLGEPYWVALALNNLADVVYALGDVAGAGALAAEGLDGSRGCGDAYGTALGLGTMAAVACAGGELPRAVELYGESLALWSAMGDQRGVGGVLAGLAGVAAAAGEFVQAARLLGAATALAEAVDASTLFHHERYELTVAAVRAALDETSFARAWDAGRALMPAHVADLVAEITEAHQ